MLPLLLPLIQEIPRFGGCELETTGEVKIYMINIFWSSECEKPNCILSEAKLKMSLWQGFRPTSRKLKAMGAVSSGCLQTEGFLWVKWGNYLSFHLTGRLMVFFLFESGQATEGNKEGEQGSSEVVWADLAFVDWLAGLCWFLRRAVNFLQFMSGKG